MSSLYQILQSGVDTPPVNHSHPLRDLTIKNPTSSAKSLGFSKILELID
jgi:hypothetical protein